MPLEPLVFEYTSGANGTYVELERALRTDLKELLDARDSNRLVQVEYYPTKDDGGLITFEHDLGTVGGEYADLENLMCVDLMDLLAERGGGLICVTYSPTKDGSGSTTFEHAISASDEYSECERLLRVDLEERFANSIEMQIAGQEAGFVRVDYYPTKDEGGLIKLGYTLGLDDNYVDFEDDLRGDLSALLVERDGGLIRVTFRATA